MNGMSEEDLYQLLSTSPAITALVGDRVDNGDLPEGRQLPAVTFMYVSGRHLNTLHGGFTGHSHNRWSISVWGKTYAQCKELQQAVIDTMAGHILLAIMPLHERDKQLYRFALDYSIYE
jgi:hypothetical protein